MTLLRTTTPLIAALVLAGPSLPGAEAHFGGQVTASRPQSDLGGSSWMDGRIAPGLGAHILVDMEDGNALVPRLDYTMHKRTERVLGVDVDRKTDVWNLGVDYNYYFSGRASEGFYLLAGLGYASAKFDVSGAGASWSQTKGAVGYALGAGLMFTPNIGMEVRYTHARFSDLGPTSMGALHTDVNAPALTASFLLRY